VRWHLHACVSDSLLGEKVQTKTPPLAYARFLGPVGWCDDICPASKLRLWPDRELDVVHRTFLRAGCIVLPTRNSWRCAPENCRHSRIGIVYRAVIEHQRAIARISVAPPKIVAKSERMTGVALSQRPQRKLAKSWPLVDRATQPCADPAKGRSCQWKAPWRLHHGGTDRDFRMVSGHWRSDVAKCRNPQRTGH
jgi:hypothetical protein